MLARRGTYEKAEQLAREAVEIGETTEELSAKAETRADLAEVLAFAGRPDEAAPLLEEALALFEAKENVVRAEQTRARLAEVG